MNVKIAAIAIAASINTLESAFSQDGNILDKAGKFIPTVAFTESYTEKVGPRFGRLEVLADWRFTARIVANLSDLDPAQITEDTPIGVTIGDFRFDATIRDLLPRDRSGAPLPLTPAIKGGTLYFCTEKLDLNDEPIEDISGRRLQMKVGSVSVSWANARLAVSVKIGNCEKAGAGSVIDGLGLVGLADDGVKGGALKFANQGVPVAVSFGSLTGERTAYAKGLTRTTYRAVKGDTFALNAAAVTGAADLAGPVLAAAVPATDGGTGFLDFSGTVTDLAANTLPDRKSGQWVEVVLYIDDPTVAEPIAANEFSEPDALGKRTFTFASVAIDPGVHTLTIVASDDSGNQRLLKKTVVSTAGLTEN